MTEFKIVGINSLKPNPRNARTHSNPQLNQIAESLKKFKFLAPIIADDNFSLT